MAQGTDGAPEDFIRGYEAALRDLSRNWPQNWLEMEIIAAEGAATVARKVYGEPEWLAGAVEEAVAIERARSEQQQWEDRRRQPKSPKRPGWVYLMLNESGTKVKIGWTARAPRKRLGEVERQAGDVLRLIGCCRGTLDDERELHATYTEYRLPGEWFRIEGRLAEFVAERMAALARLEAA